MNDEIRRKIEEMLGANETAIGQNLIPGADRCRCRPAMVQDESGAAVIYVEIVIPPPHVHLMMTSVAGLQRNTTVLASDAAQVLYDFVMRARGTYFQGRVKPL